MWLSSMQRIKIDFKEKRNVASHDLAHLSAMEWLDIWNADRVYFDDDRKYGYGGYRYDGRWKDVVCQLKELFSLNTSSSLLDVGCAKGFLVEDYCRDPDVGAAEGVDLSFYSLLEGKKQFPSLKLVCSNFTDLPFSNNEFTLAFCKDSLHNILTKDEVITSLREIQRVSQKSWIRVGAFNTNSQKKVIDDWAVFATTYLHVDEWLEIFEQAEYRGAYDWFHPTEIIA